MNAYVPKESRGRRWAAPAAAVLVLAAAAAAAVILRPGAPLPPIQPVLRGPSTLDKGDVPSSAGEWHGPETPYVARFGEIRRNDTFSEAVGRLGFDGVFVETLAGIMKGVLSFNKCRPGDVFEIRTDRADGRLIRFAYQATPVDVWVAERTEDGRFEAYREEFEEEKRVVWVTGRIVSSLYEAVEDAKEDPSLAMMIANEVFAWDIDFYTEAQKDDVFRVAVEKHYSGDYFVKYGRILAAEYDGAVGRKQAFSWRDPSGRDGYYNAQGLATRRVFLRSPLKYAHVSSSFGRRFHPVFRQVRMHHGVDYAAPTGTPVWAVADGTVTDSGRMGGLGNAVKIRHSSGYQSVYGHLSRISPVSRAGARVKQGMVIGFVGSTGISTGPHLHFSLLVNGKYINPQKRVAPPTEPIPARSLAAFRESIRPWLAKLDELRAPGRKEPA